MLPTFRLPTSDVRVGVALMVGMGVLAGVMPAVAAMRLRITDALRRA
jgi:putative ABC transport system permease protein